MEPAEVRRLLLKKLGKKDTASLEAEWKAFIAAIPIEAPEARFKRAYRQVMYGIGEDSDEAMADLDFAIDNGFDDPRAYWARGRLRTFKAGLRSGEAVSDFKKAIELDPLNAAYRFDLAQALSGHIFSLRVGNMSITLSSDDNDSLRGSDEDLAAAKVEFGLAMALDPESDLYAETFEHYMSMYEKRMADD